MDHGGTRYREITERMRRWNKMGIASMDEVIDYVRDDTFRERLSQYKDRHILLQEETSKLLEKYNDEGKDLNPIAKGMSWVKTNVKLVFNESDQTIADLVTDGCNMGVKFLNKYLNQYDEADESSKNVAKKLINLEDDLSTQIRRYL